jgi:hypothetical protein
MDMVDHSVAGGDYECLLGVRNHTASPDLDLEDDGECRADFVTDDRELAVANLFEEAVLRTAIQAAPQVISGESGLEAVFDADAVACERHHVGIVADEGVEIGLGRGDTSGVGNGVHRLSIG